MRTNGAARLLDASVRHFSLTDVPTVDTWLAHPLMQKAIDDEKTTPAARRQRLRAIARSTPMRDGQGGFVIERNAIPIGFIHLMWINWISRTGEIDLLVAPGAMRSIAGFSVIQKAGEIAFERLNLNKVYGFVYADNAVSLSPLKKIMRIEATMRSAAVREGVPTDVHVVSMTASHYYSLKQSIAWHEHQR